MNSSEDVKTMGGSAEQVCCIEELEDVGRRGNRLPSCHKYDSPSAKYFFASTPKEEKTAAFQLHTPQSKDILPSIITHSSAASSLRYRGKLHNTAPAKMPLSERKRAAEMTEERGATSEITLGDKQGYTEVRMTSILPRVLCLCHTSSESSVQDC
jgi:hypothetical protein